MSNPAYTASFRGPTKLVENLNGSSHYSRRMQLDRNSGVWKDTSDSRSRMAKLYEGEGQFFITMTCYKGGNELMFSAFYALYIKVSFHVS